MGELSTRNAELTEKQRLFVYHYAKGLTQTEAAQLAGYSQPGTDGYRLLQLPHVLDAFHKERDKRIRSRVANLAVDRLEDALKPGAVPLAKVQPFIKLALDYAGHAVPEEAKRDKDLDAMSPDELIDLIRRWQADQEATAAAQAKDISPGSAPDNARPAAGDPELPA